MTPNSLNLYNAYGMKSILLEQYPPEAWDFLSGEPDGIDAVDVKELSASVPWLYRGLNILVQAVSTVPIALTKGKTDAGYVGDPEINSPFPWIADMPNLLQHIAASLILEGRGYLFRDKASKIQATKKLWYWSPLSVTFDGKATKESKTLTFVRRVDGVDTPYTDKEVIYFWPEDTYVEIGPPNNSPAKAALCAAGVLYNVDQYVAAYFKRGAIKAMMLAVKGNPPKDEKERLQKWWTDLTSGIKKAFNIFTMNAESVTPTVVGDGLEGLQDSELTREKREDISTALGIPQSILFSNSAGGLGGGGVVSEDTLRFYQMTVVPLAKFMADTMNRQQLKDTGYTFQVRDEEMDVFQEDENSRATAVQSTVTSLADPQLYLIAAAIQGVELSPEVEKMIQEQIARKEEERKKMEEKLAQQGAPVPGAKSKEEEPDKEEEPAFNKAMEEDLARLRRKAIKNLGKLFTFESDNIPGLDALLVQLNACKCAEEVAEIIKSVTVTPAPEYSQPDYSGLIEAMRLEIQAMTLAKSLIPVPQPPPNVNITNNIPKAEPVVNVTPEVKAPDVQVTNEVQPAPVTVMADNEPQKEFVKRIRRVKDAKE